MENKPPDVAGVAGKLVAELAAIGVKAELTMTDADDHRGVYGGGYSFEVEAEAPRSFYRRHYNGKIRIKYRRASGDRTEVVQRPQPKAGFDLAAIAADMKATLPGLDAARARVRERRREIDEVTAEAKRVMASIPAWRPGVGVQIDGSSVDSLSIRVGGLTLAQVEAIVSSREFLDAIGAKDA